MNETSGMMPTVRVTRIDDTKAEGKGIKAFADVVIAEQFAIKGIRVMEGPKGLFVGMPSRKDGNGGFVEMFHPITKEARELLHAMVTAAYKIGKGGMVGGK